MKKSEVIQIVVEVLTKIQSTSGREAVMISGRTCPIGELPDFDSLNGVEATVELVHRLGVDLPGVNVFTDKDGTRALRVSEISDNICSELPTRG